MKKWKITQLCLQYYWHKFEENKSPPLLKDNEVGFLESKDLSIKKDIGNRIFDKFIKNRFLKFNYSEWVGL